MNPKAAIRNYIRDELLEGAPLTGDPLAQGPLDSLALEQLFAFIEDTYEITLEDRDLVSENFESLGAVAALVRRKLRTPAAEL